VRDELARSRKKPDSIKNPAPAPVRGFSFPASISTETMFITDTATHKHTARDAMRTAAACMALPPPPAAAAS